MIKDRYMLKLFFLLLITFEFSFAASKSINVTFVSPAGDNDEYWKIAHSFANSSAKDLNIQLEIKKSNTPLDKFEYLESLKEVFERKNKPDFVIAKFYEKITIDILSLSEVYNIPIFIINSNISKVDKKIVGKLRRKFENFIGHIAPNEEKVGYDLARYLIDFQRQTNPNGRLKVSAIATSKKKNKSKLRLKGLKKAVKEEFRTKLYKTVYSPSNPQEAYIQANRLIKKYYDINIIWTETGLISLGATEAINDNSLTNQTITGGIGFTNEVLKAVKNKQLTVAIGGQFTDLGFALVLINDYYFGKDFYEQYNSKIDSNMFLITTQNVDKYVKLFKTQDWNKIDFKKYSKVYNKNLDKYNFSIKNLFDN